MPIFYFLSLFSGPVSGVGQHADFHGSSSDDADDPSSRGSTRPNSAHDEEQVKHFPPFY
jgi:hypothetical protein